MVADSRTYDLQGYASPIRRVHASELLAMTLLVAAIVYTFLQYFTLEQVQPAYVGDLAAVESQASAAAAEGNVLNQFFWVFMFAGALPLIWRYQRRFILLTVSNWPLVLTMAFCLLSVSWAIDPDIAFRRFAQMVVITVFSMAIVVALPSPKQFIQACLIATAIVLVLDLLIIPAIPWLAFNYLHEYEGVHKHKNLAGGFLMIAGIVWFFATLRFRGFARRAAGFALLAVIVLLLVLTQSKTSQAILPMAILFAWIVAASARRGQWWFALTISFLVFSTLTATLPLGVVSPFAIIGELYGDVTLTGRTIIWNFTLAMIEREPWFGYGYGSFWGIGDASPNIRYASTDLVYYVGQAHNGYLDITAMTGMIGLALSVIMLLVPFLSLFRIAEDADADDMRGSGLAVMLALLVAGLIQNITESSILRAGNATWFFMLFAILYISAIRHRVGHGARRRPVSRR